MTLLDEWELGDPGAVGSIGQNVAGVSQDDGLDDFPGSPTSASEPGICSLEVVDRQMARTRGRVTAVAVGSECLLVVTSRAVLLRYDFAVRSQPVSEVELSRAPDAHATHIWADRAAMHAIIAVTVGNTLGSSSELQYVHAKWKKPKTLSKLMGARISAVAWDHSKVTEGSTGPVLLGSERGILQELSVEERDKKDGASRQLYDFEDAPEPIRGLQQQPLPGNKALVLVATPARLYVFVGGPTLEMLFKSYPDSAADLRNCLHCPGEAPPSGLLQVWAPVGSDRARHFCWASQAGLQHGTLLLDREKRPASDLEYLAQDAQLPLRGPEPILSMALTQFHVLLLAAGRLLLVSRVSGQAVQDMPLSSLAGGAYMQQPAAAAPLRTLLRDEETSTIYLAAGEALYEVALDNEERDLWRSFLERGDYAAAQRYASTQAERDVVSRAEAEVAFEGGDHGKAAQLWGAVRSGEPSFEEIALRFVGAGATDALQAFLMARLQVLGPDDKAQATMVASWVVELYLDQINRALLEDTPAGAVACAARGEALRAFLRDHVAVLDVNVTVALLASYGRMDDLMHYATYRQDNETVLEYLLQRGEGLKALAVLRRPGFSQELVYKFAPALIAAVPSETVDAWIAASPPLEPRRLMPALMRVEDEPQPRASHAVALRYVQFCISRLGSLNPTVHNLAVTLYSQQKDERELLELLQSSRDPLGKPLYDPQFALRVARQHGHLHACVQLLCELNLHEDAVALALTFDRTVASAVAARAEDNEALQRKLWLAIARHLIDGASEKSGSADPGERVAAVVEVLEEAEGRIRIEDVLPLFPDFVTIDAFKAAICASLEDYKAQIERLKAEMSDATRMADALRRDMAALDGQAGTLDLTEPCARCGRALTTVPGAGAEPSGGSVPHFYLFPTGNAFHGACLAAEVMASTAPEQQSKIVATMKQLSQIPPEAPSDMQLQREKLVKTLEAYIAVEDPYNGEIVVRMINQGFIDPGESAEIASWEL